MTTVVVLVIQELYVYAVVVISSCNCRCPLQYGADKGSFAASHRVGVIDQEDGIKPAQATE